MADELSKEEREELALKNPYAQTGTVDTTEGTPDLRKVSPFLNTVLPGDVEDEEQAGSEEGPKTEAKSEEKTEAESGQQASSARKGRTASTQSEKKSDDSDQK